MVLLAGMLHPGLFLVVVGFFFNLLTLHRLKCFSKVGQNNFCINSFVLEVVYLGPSRIAVFVDCKATALTTQPPQHFKFCFIRVLPATCQCKFSDLILKEDQNCRHRRSKYETKCAAVKKIK